LGGIPQRGDALGSPRAPYTLFEFADLQCPFCSRFDRDVLPAVIRDFVRPGRLRLELHPVVLIGPDSAPAAAAAIAAGGQNRMWDFADLFYRNQRPENSGYVTRQFIDWIGAAVPGLDVARLERARHLRTVISTVARNIGLAHAADLSGTPDFRLGATGGILLPFVTGIVPRAEFVSRLAAAIKVMRNPVRP
jgi:protein-disulfide isomerase